MVVAHKSARPLGSPYDDTEHAKGSTLASVGLHKTNALCDGLGLTPAHCLRAQQLFQYMTSPWAQRSSSVKPSWPSDITDDGTPFELSAAFSGGVPKFRLLVESQSETIGEHSTWDAGLDLNARLANDGLADLSGFSRISHLFAPRQRPARFSIWHAAALSAAAPPLFKVYLNPLIAGDSEASQLLEQAMIALDHSSSWAFLEPLIADPENRILYFSLDLSFDLKPRVKVYIGRSDTAAAAACLVRGSANVTPSQAAAWIEALSGRTSHFQARPILSCFAFSTAREPPSATLHIPVRCYLESDAECLRRVSQLLTPPEAGMLGAALNGLATETLEQSKGLMTYASVRGGSGDDPRHTTTVYLAPQAFGRQPGSKRVKEVV